MKRAEKAERIQEIGLRKAMGARRSDILRQFLVESVVLSAFGGLFGVLGATAIARIAPEPPVTSALIGVQLEPWFVLL